MSHRRLTRRAFIGGTAATASVLWSTTLWTPARARALRQVLDVAVAPGGTTLESTILRATGDGYRRLVTSPGWPTVVRNELGVSPAGPSATRTPIASIVHLTDIHIIDAQSTARVEFLDDLGDPFTAAFRPQETLTCHVQSSMVRRVNELGGGPITGRPFDCAVSTGDNIDNMQWNELQWFLTLLDGGPVAANSGAAGVYEGVQTPAWADPRYWHPDVGAPDVYKSGSGFPDMPGLLEAAVAPFVAPSIACPWYSTYGNHDGLLQGNLPAAAALDDILVGSRKVTDPKAGQSPLQFVAAMFGDPTTVRNEIADGTYPGQPVTPDADRRTVRTQQWVQAHLDSPSTPGPHGHGYTPDHLERDALYYEFEIAPGVLGISMDTGGFNSGTIGQIQLDWIEATIRAASSRWFDAGGTLVQSGNADQLVLLFSHFNARSMTSSLTDPARPDERRYTGAELLDVFHRYPNIVAWVNGHHHVNQIEPLPDPSGRTNGFWDINTCSHVDWPEQARIVELTDNQDGTLSIFTTMIEHAAPPVVEYDDTSVLGLASISRELSANNPQSDLASALGQPKDLNVELVLPAPFDLRHLGQVPVPVAVGATPRFAG